MVESDRCMFDCRINDIVMSQSLTTYLIMTAKQEESFGLTIQAFFVTVLISLLIWRIMKSSERKRELQEQKKEVKKVAILERKIVVLAFEILNLFVKYSERWRPGYTLLHDQGTSFLAKVWNFMRGNSPCYQECFSKLSIRKFIKELKQISNTKIMIYTKLESEACNKILVQLGIHRLFEQKDKIFARPDSLKSAEFVDHDTGRVIIISANSEDQDGVLSNHHGLILDVESRDKRLEEELLDELNFFFRKLLEKGRKDLLHEEMHQLALEMNLPIFTDDSSE